MRDRTGALALRLAILDRAMKRRDLRRWRLVTSVRTAAFLFAAASLGSLAAATASRFPLAFLAAAVALAVSVTSWRYLARREAREARDRTEALGQPYRDVLRMASGGAVRRAYVRDAVPGSEEEATAA